MVDVVELSDDVVLGTSVDISELDAEVSEEVGASVVDVAEKSDDVELSEAVEVGTFVSAVLESTEDVELGSSVDDSETAVEVSDGV